MSQKENRGLYIFELILLLLIAVFTIQPVANYDFWFHIKYGEYIFQTYKLPFTDVFSHSAYGQAAVPYEWLFQAFIYLIYRFLGTAGVQATVIFFSTSYIFVFRQILRNIFGVSVLPRMLLTAALFVLGYNFWVERPQIVAYLLFIITLYIVLKRIFIGKSRLWLTPIIFLIWTNLHASMILGLYLFFSFSAVLFIRFLARKDTADLSKAKDLFIFGLINSAITILPPLGIKVYKLLILFWENREFITQTIDEWVPLTQLTIEYYIYLAVFLLVAVALIWVFIKNKTVRPMIFILIPFVPLSLFVLTGIRQAPFTLPVTFLLFIPAIGISDWKISKTLKYAIASAIIIPAIWGMNAYRGLAVGAYNSYPSVAAVSFVKNNLKGNMFNEYHIGGYLLYSLGPEMKTFIDGRTDMFVPEVFPDYMSFSYLTYTDDDYYLDKFENLSKKYNISWVILTTNRYTLSSRLARILENAPGWSLVFFDDTARIYVKEDGINKGVLSEFSMSAVTPFGKRIYRKDLREQAKNEYSRMNERSKSAVAANALGFMLLEDNKYDEAKEKFLNALKIKPDASAPKMNLAELAAQDGDYAKAVSLYRQVIKDDPERGLAYLRLGQLIVDSGGSAEEAKDLWNKGLKTTPDDEIIRKIKEELNKN